MTLANEVATRTTCMRRAVGAVIVKDRRILATGYNGVPTGMRQQLQRPVLLCDAEQEHDSQQRYKQLGGKSRDHCSRLDPRNLSQDQ